MTPKIEFSQNNTKIYDSYLYNPYEINEIVGYIMEKRRDYGFILTRSKKSYICEINVHNRLYKLGIKKDHTKDADLEEPINPILEKIYFILGR